MNSPQNSIASTAAHPAHPANPSATASPSPAAAAPAAIQGTIRPRRTALDPSTLTIDQWFPHFTRLYLGDARPATIEAYANTVVITQRILGPLPIVEVDPYVVAEYRTACPGRAATVAKHCRHLNAMLGKLGPAGPRCRDALGLLPEVPYFKPPRCEEPTPQVPTDAEVGQFVAAAAEPYALFAVLAATTGSRQTALRLMPLSAVDGSNRVIRLPSATDKKGRARIKPLPEITVRWWQGATDKGWATSKSGFATRWRREAEAAGTPRLRPHGLKRWWGNKLVAHHASPWCVKYALDHAQRDVTGRHYLQPYDELAELVDQVELPAAFTTRLAALAGRERQLSLF